MNTRKFSHEENKISVKTYFDLVEFFTKNLVVGLECERAINLNSQILAERLNAQYTRYGGSRGDSSLGRYKKAMTNEYNVAFVSDDSSVTYGNEIIFNGTAEKFGWIHSKLFALEKKLNTLDCKEYDSSCSNHITLLTLQDKLINPIILKNLYNLVRAFSPALYWLCSGDKINIVRSGASNYASFSNMNPKNKSFRDLKSMIPRTAMINYQKQNTIEMVGEELLSGIVVEFRNTDGFRVPCVLTSLMAMYKALMFKALELSTKGLINIESIVDFEKSKQNVNKILQMNNSSLTTSEKKEFTKLSEELIEFILPDLKRISPESIPILRELAKKPVSQRSGKWESIEKSLMKKINKKITDKEQILILAVLDNEVEEKTAGKWKKKIAEKMGVCDRMIEYMMKKIESKTNQRFVFDSEIKSYRFQ